jgi:tetratricopeptide (TPR) repeat protein
MDGRYSQAYARRGALHFKRGSTADAIRDLEKAIQLDPALKKDYEPLLIRAREKHGGPG